MDYFFSFTVVNYALKFSDFGIDGADRYFLEHTGQAFLKKIFPQYFEASSWRENCTTEEWAQKGKLNKWWTMLNVPGDG